MRFKVVRPESYEENDQEQEIKDDASNISDNEPPVSPFSNTEQKRKKQQEGKTQKLKTNLKINVSTTKIIPGMTSTLTLTVTTHTEGPFSIVFGLIGEVEEYEFTVSGTVLSSRSFGSVVLMRRLEGRGMLSDGVRFVRSLGIGEKVDSEDENGERNDENDNGEQNGNPLVENNEENAVGNNTSNQPQDTIKGLFDDHLLNDISAFPTLPGTYYCKDSNTMKLDGLQSLHPVDGTVKLDRILTRYNMVRDRKSKALECSGNLSTRCLTTLGFSGENMMVERQSFRNLNRAKLEGDNNL